MAPEMLPAPLNALVAPIADGSPQRPEDPPPAAPEPEEYVVQPGDNLWSIARAHGILPETGVSRFFNEFAQGVTTVDGREFNGPNSILQPGDRVIIPGEETTPVEVSSDDTGAGVGPLQVSFQVPAKGLYMLP